jgi:hypothetical protein
LISLPRRPAAIILREEDAAMDANEYLLDCMVRERLEAGSGVERAGWRPSSPPPAAAQSCAPGAARSAWP